MDIIFYNTGWMLFNLYLAVLPVIFSLFLFKMKHKIFSLIVGLLWILYLPNTIYVFTDLHHLIEQWILVDFYGKSILILQYAILQIVGLSCFLVAFYPFEKIVKNVYFLIILNFVMGFAMVLGKVERVNSWDIFVNPKSVLLSSLDILVSIELMGLVILFGLFTNLFYFLFRDKLKKIFIPSDLRYNRKKEESDWH